MKRTHCYKLEKSKSQPIPQPKSPDKTQSTAPVAPAIRAKSNEEGLAEWKAQQEKWARFGTPWMNKVPNPSGDLVQPWIQRKLTLGQPGDKYEQEADRVASQVVQQINAPSLSQFNQEQSVQQENELEGEMQAKSLRAAIQRRQAMTDEEASADLESSINSARGGGQPLDAVLQQSMGQAMGADFSGVRVHTDTQSNHLNQSIQARAFTTGQDVFFREGAYQPWNRGGQELIAHELTHVIQQRGTQEQTNRLSMKDCLVQKDGDEEVYGNQYEAHYQEGSAPKKKPTRWHSGNRVVPLTEQAYRDRSSPVYPPGGDQLHDGYEGDPLYQELKFAEFNLANYPHINQNNLDKYESAVRGGKGGNKSAEAVVSFYRSGGTEQRSVVLNENQSKYIMGVYISAGGKLVTPVSRTPLGARYYDKSFPSNRGKMAEQSPQHVSSHSSMFSSAEQGDKQNHRHYVYPGGDYAGDLEKFVARLENTPGALGTENVRAHTQESWNQTKEIGAYLRNQLGLPVRNYSESPPKAKKSSKKSKKSSKKSNSKKKVKKDKNLDNMIQNPGGLYGQGSHGAWE